MTLRSEGKSERLLEHPASLDPDALVRELERHSEPVAVSFLISFKCLYAVARPMFSRLAT